MPKKGQVLLDRFTGDSIEFIETAADTGGDHVTLKVHLKSIGKTVDDHIHLLQSESFKVLEGKMTYFLDGKEMHLTKGQEITLPRDVPHNHYNTHPQPVKYIQTISPAMDIDLFIENLFGLINDGKVKKGNLQFLQAMVTLKYLDSPSLLANLPRGLQRGLATVLAPLARFLGYRAIYKKYTGVEK